MRTYRPALISSLFVIFACLGLGRFGFGIVLPNLQDDLNITTTAAGFIGTTNFIGYLIGIFFVHKLYERFQAANLISTVLLLQGMSMLVMSLLSNYLLISFFYTLSGIFSAISNVAVMVYIAHIIPQNLRGKALGIVVTGIGLAIIFSGFYVPIIEEFSKQASWRVAWISFALLVILIAVLSRKGLSLHDSKTEDKNQDSFMDALKNSAFWKISLVYVIFGTTYVVYVTYFVLASMQKHGLNIEQSGYFWSLLGCMSLISGPLFGAMADKIGAYKTLIFVFTLLATSNLILALDLPSFTLIISAISFGIAAWSIPSLVTLLTSIHFGKNKTAQVFSMITILFAIGQTVGPVAGGYIFDMTSSFDAVFMGCALLCTVGLISTFIFSKQKVPTNS